MDKVLGSIPRNTMQCLYAWKNVFEWSRRVEKLYVVQEMNWPYLYVAFHSMHTLWSSIHDSSSSSLSVFTVRSCMFMKINIYLMFIFIYIFFIYVYENKHISAPEHSVKSFFENRMKIQDKKNPLRNGGTAVLTVCGKLELIDNCRTSKNAKYWLEFCSVIIVDNANENSVGRAYLTSRYLCKDLSRWRFVLSNSSCEMQMCYTIKYLS